jgi:hypothetical protein
MECRDILIYRIAAESLAESPKACRPGEGLKSRSAHAPGDTWQGHQARTPQGGLHSQRKILGVQSKLARLQEHTDLGRSRIQGIQLGCQSRRHTEVLQDLGIEARRPHEDHFGAQTTSIATSHPTKPWH